MTDVGVSQADTRFAVAVLVVSVLVGLITAVVFVGWPWLDIVIARAFFNPDEGFVLNNFWVGTVRRLVLAGSAGWYVALTVGVILAASSREPVMGHSFRQWMYLVACSLAGPMAVANLLLKENWGRARPRQITELGGNLEFTPVLQISDQCAANCSFVSGEVSSVFMIFISLAMVSAGWRRMMVWLALAMGAVVGLIRVGMGGHFTSDSIFACVLMAAIAAVLYWIFFANEESRAGRA